MKYFLILAAMFALTGCEERYRYPCQDPHNWEKTFCQKPFCSANGTCPEDLKHYERNRNGQQVVQQNQQTTKPGECK